MISIAVNQYFCPCLAERQRANPFQKSDHTSKSTKAEIGRLLEEVLKILFVIGHIKLFNHVATKKASVLSVVYEVVNVGAFLDFGYPGLEFL